MEKFPYLFLGSPPIGPIALQALTLADYAPAAVLDDPGASLDEQLAAVDASQATFILVVGYGAILKQPLLDSVAGQVLNIHPSLLPQYRGPSPVVQAILDGARETGVTLMEIDRQMDHGPILAQERIPLRGNELPGDLYNILTVKGVDLFLQNINDYLQEQLTLTPQNHAEATFTRLIKKEDGRLDFRKPAEELERQIRAFHDWPRSWTEYKGKRLIIEKAHLENGQLMFDLVQPENGKVMTFAAFCAGQRQQPHDIYHKLTLWKSQE
ncbi:methionyl-tRNA formyltransferase [Patescibacteria group bacterium]|nr:methionyl-tRNA formyltransferase [Patescibacteria group bacterium]